MSKTQYFDHVIIGNSAAAIGGVEAIRHCGCNQSIGLISQEPYQAYARHLISRYLIGDQIDEQNLLFRPTSFYERHRVHPYLGVRAEQIVWDQRQVRLASGETVEFGQLLLAVGAKPVVPPFPGHTLHGIYTFTTLEQAAALRQALPFIHNVVVIGGGLIGLQVAEALKGLGKQVTVVELAPRLLTPVLDATAGDLVKAVLEKGGIHIRLDTPADALIASAKDRQSVGAVRLRSGEVLPADAVILAVGVSPRTDLVEGSPLTLNRGIVVNELMETNLPGVFAAGDVAAAPDIFTGEHRTLPIWPNAYRQGYTAGLTMAGQKASGKPSVNFNAAHFFGFPVVSAGRYNHDPSNACQTLTLGPTPQGDYKKLILQDNQLVGLVATGCYIDQAGFYTGLIQSKVTLGANTVKQLLVKGDYTLLPPDQRRSYLRGTAFNTGLRLTERRITA